MMRRTLIAALAVFAALATPATHAQSGANSQYPVRALRFIVPFPPGGGNDTVARVVGNKLADAMGVSVVIDNRGGGGGNIGMELAARAAPDGYTLLLGSFTTLVINHHAYPGLAFDPVKSFSAVSQLASSALMIVVHPALPVRSVRDLIAEAKRQPGKLNYAAGSTAGHLAGEWFESHARIHIVHIPYKGNAQALTDVIGGQVPVFFGGILAAQPHVQSGRVRALAVTGAKRSPAVPELPTVSEAGLPGYEVDSWYGVLVPRGTPRNRVLALNGAILKVLELPGVKEQLVRQGAAPAGGTPEQFDAYVHSQVVQWGPVIKAAGVRPD